MRLTPLLLGSLLALAHCRRAPDRPAAPARSLAPAAAPARDAAVVRADPTSRAAWPPEGAGCERLARCCEQSAAPAPEVGPLCQRLVASAPLDCARALAQVRSFLAERRAEAPASCGDGPLEAPRRAPAAQPAAQPATP